MRTIYFILALILASLNMRPAITSVAPLLDTIQQQLGMSGLASSLLTTLPVLCMGIFAPFAAKISQKIGLEKAIFLSLLLLTAATAVRGITGSVIVLIVTAFLAGIGIGIAGPLLSGFIKQYFPTRPGFVSIYSVSMSLGAGIAAGLSVPIYNSAGQNWGFALASWAVLGVAALTFWIKLALQKRTEVTAAKARLPLKNKRAILVTLFFALMSSMFYSVTAWIAPIVQDMGYSKSTAAAMLTVFTFIQIPTSMLLPTLVAKFGRLTTVLVACSMLELAGIGILLAGLHPLPAALLLGIGAGGLFPLALMLPIVETDSPQEASAWSSMNQGGGYILAAIGPLAVGAISDMFGSFYPALLVMAGVVVAMAAVQLLLKKHGRAIE
ncbi:MFS transporter [Shouchella clausii]|uniref:Major facilitator superfamily (MFS) profile domain-containing protein n=5 Tax=Shouchella TaxID=2893057 RepID=Q5WAR7_SHOC1|nr:MULTISPECIES: MFS transporter [Shouchella]MCM3311344.1 MFS transporter [Psychrobacillus sp. MER TA 17]ALA53000.1 Cyanate MFS transporter [Shouchella clausii]KKI86646.1 MFS transporter [Shouchella clausii]MBU3231440.1 MFS transporter [Shouchella clausii]MBU3263557.1 MFS transporter [Shouchella clausii]